jgi:hypothetical protein
VFERACHLLTPAGDVVALVVPHIGDGPLNIVVERLDQSWRLVQSGMPATLQDGRLYIGDMEIALDGAAVWEPRPDWAHLRARRDQIARRLPLLHTLAHAQAPAGSLLALPSAAAPAAPPAPQSGDDAQGSGLRQAHGAILAVAEQASLALGTAWRSGRDAEGQLASAAARLAGLGHGLTPAGDDFLMGAMLRAWLAHPEPERLCQPMVEAAAPRTTTLSAALLRAAARGECSAAWHALLAALAAENSPRADVALANAIRDVLAHGQTSGGDTLAGFLAPGLACS